MLGLPGAADPSHVTAERGSPIGRLELLHIMLDVGTESYQNQFCLGSRHRISVVTFFPTEPPWPSDMTLFDGDGTFSGFFRALGRAVRSRSYDVVHAHGPIDGFLFLLYALGRRDLIRNSVYTVHHSFTNSNLKLRNRLLTLPVFAGFREIVFVSGASLESFPSAYLRLARGRIRAIPNGVNFDRVGRALRGARIRGAREVFRVLSVGRLIPIKNSAVILEAYRRVVDESSELVFVGEGELRSDLEERCRAARLGERVRFAGLMPRENLYRLLASADVFVSASSGEGMPVAVLEAMACRCPVILSDIAPHREIAGDADFVPLIGAEDAPGYARELERIRRMDPARRKELGRRCRNLVERRFSLDSMHGEYDTLYASLVRARRRREDE